MYTANITTFTEEAHVIVEQSAAGGWFFSSCILLLLLFALIDKLLKLRQMLLDAKKELDTSHQTSSHKDEIIKKWHQTESILQQSRVIRIRVEVSPSLPILFISDNISDLGYNAEELITLQTPFTSLIHPEDLPRLRTEVTELIIQKGQIYEQTYRLRGRNGDWIWVNDRILVERDENGHPVALEGLLIDITKIKLLEEQLNRSKEDYASLFHKIYDPVVIIDRETYDFINVNNAAMNVYGYTHEEFMRMNLRDLVDEEYLEKAKSNTQASDFIKARNCVHRLKNGNKINVEMISNETVYSGKIVYISTLRDVTHQFEIEAERQRLMDSVQESREFLNTILDAIPNPVYVKDTSGKFVGYNLAFEKLLGDPKTDWRGKTTMEVSSNPEVGHKHFKMDMELFQNPGQQVFDSRLTFNDGQTHDVVMYRATFENSDGNLGGLVGTVLDITHRKKIEDELLEQKALLEEAQRIAHMGVWSWDLENNNFKWTDPLFEMLGIEKTPIIHYKQFADILHPDDEAESLKVFQEAAKSSSPSFEMTNRVYDKTGNLKHFQIIGKIKRNSEGRVERVIGIGRNITPQIENEHRLMQLINEVKQVNNELNDFAYIVSHDLKAPLRSINSLSQWLIDDYGSKMPDEANEMLQLMSKQVERMHTLIEGVLNYSKATSQKEQNQLVDLNEVVEETLGLLAAPEHINISVETKLPVLLLDRTRITQVFQNLISNSIKYMDKPEGFIKVAAVQGSSAWLFSVSDNGPGIPNKDFDKIFKIFQTVGDKDSFESTGIGLTVVKKIISLYKGTIWVESTLGEGTTFYFTIPISPIVEFLQEKTEEKTLVVEKN